jgi:hypothetical protein
MMAEQVFKPKFDFSKVDIRKIDPDRINLGTGLQDCSLIAQTFERGAHTIPTEAAVFSTLTRSLQNRKAVANAAIGSMESYLASPADAAANATSQADQLASGVDMGTSPPNDQGMQSLNIGTLTQATHGDSFGSKLLDMARNCIPCDLRLMAFLELHPNLDLLGALEKFIQDSLALLLSLGDLLKDFNIFGDFCNLLRSLSMMCIPDLQRIIAALMAMFLLNAASLDGLIGILQGLIAPIFAPILMAITSLLSQFVMLVTNPLQCVIDLINSILKMQGREISGMGATPASKEQTQLNGGLVQLSDQLQKAVTAIMTKLDFYVGQVKAMMGELGGGDGAYLALKFEMLTLVRLIAFVIAIIIALTKGHIACDATGKPPEATELDNFFNNFLSPTMPFNVWVDPAGQIHIDEKVPNLDKAIVSTSTGVPLPQFGNMLQFEGNPLLDSSSYGGTAGFGSTGYDTGGSGAGGVVSGMGNGSQVGGGMTGTGGSGGTGIAGLDLTSAVQKVASVLTAPAQTIVPCKLQINTSDVDKVNRWIEQLNRI